MINIVGYHSLLWNLRENTKDPPWHSTDWCDYTEICNTSHGKGLYSILDLFIWIVWSWFPLSSRYLGEERWGRCWWIYLVCTIFQMVFQYCGDFGVTFYRICKPNLRISNIVSTYGSWVLNATSANWGWMDGNVGISGTIGWKSVKKESNKQNTI